MKRVVSLIVFLMSGLLTYIALVWLLGFLPKIDAVLITKILMVHLVLHELGHWIAMEYYGVPASIVFLVIVGGASPWPSSRSRYRSLSWHKLSAISLAGPSMNVIVCMGAVILYLAGQLSTYTTLLTLNVGGSLLVYNLLPVWIFDGGHFVGYLFNSVSEDRDRKYQLTMSALIIATILVVSALFFQVYFFAAWMVVYGLHHAAEHDDPLGSTSKKAMSRSQQWNWAAFYVALLATGFFTLAATAKYIIPAK